MDEWYQRTRMDDHCSPDTHCEHCRPNGDCDYCDSIEGRWIEAVAEYATSCDGCGDLTHHSLQRIPADSDDQLGYCENCRPDLFKDDSLCR